jgi:hypothetical protein
MAQRLRSSETFVDIRLRDKTFTKENRKKIRVILVEVRLQVTNIADAMPLTVDHELG